MAAVVAAASIVMVGCGGGGSATDAAESTTTTVESTTTTTAAETTTTLPDYGAQYLALVAPANCATGNYAAAIDALGLSATSTLNELDAAIPTLAPLAQITAEQFVAFYEGLVAATWPADAQAEIDDLVAEVTGEAAHWSNMGSATTWLEFAAAREPLVVLQEQSKAAAVVRAHLGLETNVLSDAEPCPVGDVAAA